MSSKEPIGKGSQGAAKSLENRSTQLFFTAEPPAHHEMAVAQAELLQALRRREAELRELREAQHHKDHCA